jgi:hypothetical protein
MPAIDFQVNEFRTYEVMVEGLSLGFINTSGGGYTPAKGEELQYDGTTVILKDGREFADVPQLRTAILNSNWLVPVGNQVRTVRPKAAGIKVRPTETRGNDPVVRTVVALQQDDERLVGSIASRKAAREAANLEATRRVPLESKEARKAVGAVDEYYVETESTGDAELDEIFGEIEEDMVIFEMEADPEEEEEDTEEDRQAEMRAEVDSDIIALLNWAEEDPTPAPKRKPKAKKKVAKRKAAAKPASARNLPVDMQDERLTMPIVQDTTETEGTVVGNVGDQKRTIVEREEEIAMSVSPATPQKPTAPDRPGITGAIVVDEQREVSRIALSSTSAPIRLDETAKVTSGSRESIQMGDSAQVGTRKTASAPPPVAVDGGVAVSRILSPAKQSFVASDANTSSTAIERAAGGKRLRVEKYEDDGEVVGNVSEGAPTTVVATGDVQEAQSGDSLQDVLPDAVSPPEPEVHRRPETDPAYEAVKMLIPDFEWDKDRPVKVRVAAALKYLEKDPQYLKGILAVETNLAREDIKKAMAEALKKRAEAKKDDN